MGRRRNILAKVVEIIPGKWIKRVIVAGLSIDLKSSVGGLSVSCSLESLCLDCRPCNHALGVSYAVHHNPPYAGNSLTKAARVYLNAMNISTQIMNLSVASIVDDDHLQRD